MSDAPMEAHESTDTDRTEVQDVPGTAGPVEDVTPGTGAVGRPDLGANPFS